jgi:acyl-CoA reductase-like NAD-dependent aldehyde dehydrogenase
MVASPATSDEVIPLWINGESFTSPALKKFPVRSAKANDKILHYALSANVAAATKACDSAAVGFENWKRTSAVERRDLLLRAADLILERKDEFITTQMEETSATEFWATTNVKTGVSHIREIASKITSLSGVIPESRLDYALAFREPIGVTLAIPP